jgi:hypothetical protein
MGKQNCWELKKCGRQPGGSREKELGTCPAALEKRLEGINGGKMGGRACWGISETLCGNSVQGSYAHKLGNCMKCEFYQAVRREEARAFVGGAEITGLLRSP